MCQLLATLGSGRISQPTVDRVCGVQGAALFQTSRPASLRHSPSLTIDWIDGAMCWSVRLKPNWQAVERRRRQYVVGIDPARETVGRLNEQPVAKGGTTQ